MPLLVGQPKDEDFLYRWAIKGKCSGMFLEPLPTGRWFEPLSGMEEARKMWGAKLVERSEAGSGGLKSKIKIVKNGNQKTINATLGN